MDPLGYGTCHCPGIVLNPESKQVSVSSTNSRPTQPVRDEWGFYDPAQAGFEAVLRKLASIDRDNDDRNVGSTRSSSASAVSR